MDKKPRKIASLPSLSSAANPDLLLVVDTSDTTDGPNGTTKKIAVSDLFNEYVPSGGVGGSTGSTDNALLRADGETGELVQPSPVTVSDSGSVAGATISLGSNTVTGSLEQFNAALTDGEFVTKENAALVEPTLTGTTTAQRITVTADPYNSGWNGSHQVPTKNDIYDKIESLPQGVLPRLTVNLVGSSDDSSYYNDDINFSGRLNNVGFWASYPGLDPQYRTLATDWASVSNQSGWVKVGPYIYVLLNQTGVERRIYRYAYNNLAAGGTLMTISGQALSITNGGNTGLIRSDGTYIYISFKAGNSTDGYVISKYSISGTTLTYMSDITLGADTFVANGVWQVMPNGKFYTSSISTRSILRYSATGVLEYTSPNESYYVASGGAWFNGVQNAIYIQHQPSDVGEVGLMVKININ